MDIEGAEYEVLMSQTCQILKKTKYLLIEIHPMLFGKERLPDLMKRIGELGFKELHRIDEQETTVHLFQNTINDTE